MIKERYFVTKANTIVTDSDIKRAALIVYDITLDSNEELDAFVDQAAEGILFEMESPTTEEFIKHGYRMLAIKNYYHAHRDEGVSLREAKAYVDEVEAKMKERGDL